MPLLQPGELGFGLLKDRAVRVGVRPERQKILVGSLRAHRVTRQRECPRKLDARRGTDRIVEDDAGVVEDLLELRRRLSTLVRGQVREATDVDRIEGAERPLKRTRRRAELVRYGAPQLFDRLCRLVLVEREKCANGRQIAEPGGRVFRNPFSRSSASARGSRDSPASARAKATPYSTSLVLERLSTANALTRAAAALPKNESHVDWPASHAAALSSWDPCRDKSDACVASGWASFRRPQYASATAS